MKNFCQNSKRALVASTIFATLLTGCGDSENFVFTNTNNDIQGVVNNQAPIAVNDTVEAIGNATLNQSAANGVLSNDTPNSATIFSFDTTTANGGTVALADDGSFTYTPVFGFTGTDTFTYTLENTQGSSTATVTLNLPNAAFYVDNSVAGNGNGDQTTPFNNLGDAVAASQDGDTIFVRAGNADYAGDITLPLGVNLIGEADGLILGQVVETNNDLLRPGFNSALVLTGRNVVAGFNFDGLTNANAIRATNASDLVVRNNTFVNHSVNAILMTQLSGIVTVTDNEFQPGSNDNVVAIDIVQSDQTAIFNISSNRFLDDATRNPGDAVSFRASGDATSNIRFQANTVTSESTGTGFDDAFELDAESDGSVTLDASNNTFTRIGENALDLDVDGNASITATLTGNTVETTGSAAFRLNLGPESSSYTASQNIVNNAGTDAFRLNADDTANRGTYTLTNNTISSPGDDGIELCAANGPMTDLVVAFITDNTITDAGAESAEFDINNSASMCVQFVRNTLNGVVLLDEDGGNLEVEQFDAPLSSVNTFEIGASVVVDSGDVTSRAAGFCATLTP